MSNPPKPSTLPVVAPSTNLALQRAKSLVKLTQSVLGIEDNEDTTLTIGDLKIKFGSKKARDSAKTALDALFTGERERRRTRPQGPATGAGVVTKK